MWLAVVRFLKFVWHELTSVLDGGRNSRPGNGQPSRHDRVRSHARGLYMTDDDYMDEDGGFLWEDGNGYAGLHEGGGYGDEGHYGVPDVYEDGGFGTGGAFDSLRDDEEEDDD